MDLCTFVAEPDVQAVPKARQFALSCCSKWGVTVDPDALALVVSELLTAALRRSSGPVTVTVGRRPNRVVISVTDPRGPEGEDGEEMFRQVVDGYAQRWGHRTDDGRLWAELEATALVAAR